VDLSEGYHRDERDENVCREHHVDVDVSFLESYDQNPSSQPERACYRIGTVFDLDS
jgi:hypothetical protein